MDSRGPATLRGRPHPPAGLPLHSIRVTSPPPAVATGESQLVRAMGVRGLAATTFNVIVGGGIFVLPAIVAADVGARAPLAYVVCAAAMGLIVLCFAEAGSRVALTGGPYAYVETALGPFVGFVGGVLVWLCGTLAVGAIARACVDSVAVFWPALGAAVGRSVVLVLLFASLTWINTVGVRQGTRVIELVTVAKLLPLALLLVAGILAAPAPAPAAAAPAGTTTLGRTVVVLVFAFAGVESALVPSGEVRDPARTVPRALGIAMVSVTALYIAIQFVAERVLGVSGLAAAQGAPLSAAAARAMGPWGGKVIAAGAAVSMLGYLSGMTLAMPRALYAFGRGGYLPRALASVHRTFRTPHVALAVQGAVGLALALTAGFARLAILSNVSVLVLYLLCCIAVLELRRRDVRAGGTPFRVPGGPMVPVAAVAVIVWILAQATLRELSVMGVVLAVCALLFLLTAPRRRALRLASPP
jgi:APA family basic amino acid/polyamine antiporter